MTNSTFRKKVTCYCPKCGKPVFGYAGKQNKVNFECNRCKIRMIKKHRGAFIDSIEMIAIR